MILGDLEMGRLGDEENGKADFKRFFRNTNLRSLKKLFHTIVTLSGVEG